jgi:hypothetical protein
VGVGVAAGPGRAAALLRATAGRCSAFKGAEGCVEGGRVCRCCVQPRAGLWSWRASSRRRLLERWQGQSDRVQSQGMFTGAAQARPALSVHVPLAALSIT